MSSRLEARPPCIEFHGQILRFKRGPDGGVLPIGRDSQPVGQAQIVLDFAKGVEHRRTIAVFRLAIGRPGLLQLRAAIPALEDRQRNGGAIGPETVGELAIRLKPASSNPPPSRNDTLGKKAARAMPMARFACAIWRSIPAMSGRRSSNVDGMVCGIVNFATRSSSTGSILKLAGAILSEDGDRLFRHLALALNLGYFRLGAEQQGFDAGNVERRRDLAGELGIDEVERLSVEVDRLGIDRILRVVSRAA